KKQKKREDMLVVKDFGYKALDELDSDDIINQEYYEALKDVLKCSECGRLTHDMRQCKLTHKNLCPKCLQEHNEKRYDDEWRCKGCAGNNQDKADRLSQKVLAGLKFKCMCECGAEINYNDLEKHYLQECPKILKRIRPIPISDFSQETIANEDKLLDIHKEEMHCVICKGILFHPYTCIGCSKSMCYKCLKEWRKTSDKCPSCNNKLELERNLTLKLLLKAIQFKCRNGCTEPVSLDDLEYHYLEKCEMIGHKKDKKDKKEEESD
ncbi:MAG: hypothetical protein MJ252_12715, partial [archaeon]|nr:hypothetical protein [archaeon]